MGQSFVTFAMTTWIWTQKCFNVNGHRDGWMKWFRILLVIPYQQFWNFGLSILKFLNKFYFLQQLCILDIYVAD